MSAAVQTQPLPELPMNSPYRLLPRDPAGASFAAHLDRYGPLPEVGGRRAALLVDEVERSGLSGRGGAGFPTAVKLRTVGAARRPFVVANGTEGEPASAKDKVLMTFNPHLVIDGVLASVTAVGADEAYLAVARGAGSAHAALATALTERRDARGIRLVAVPNRFVAGEESALVNWVNGGDAKPTFTPPRPFEKGVGGRPTLVQNVETLANVGLIARYGGDWFRERGTRTDPGTALVTVRGAVGRPGVVEVELGTPIARIVERCGGLTEPARALLVGGYFGTWIDANLELPLADSALRPVGAALGARTLAVLPRSRCGLAETARIARYLAGESAGQCGPCVFGLPALAQALDAIVSSTSDARAAYQRLPRLAGQIARRGACAHPDGALRLVDSALRVFAPELDQHLGGRCNASHSDPLLPTHHETTDWK
ncbi:MAG TPA: NADH-ubiquinone oxidoreductase-F iron-sulfur binding region domain-containing protein [Gaiellaceae bacterium]|nr:NADH-ubiquinone oxidoreductase-F iron-sulfur binding region domain-containing protein [Gaiellaceae bacterium]